MPPPSYRAGYDIVNAEDKDTVQKTTMGIMSAAQTIYANNTTTSSVHIARRALATNVLRSPDTYARPFALAFTVTQTQPYTDATILAGINAAWDAMAGA